MIRRAFLAALAAAILPKIVPPARFIRTRIVYNRSGSTLTAKRATRCPSTTRSG